MHVSTLSLVLKQEPRGPTRRRILESRTLALKDGDPTVPFSLVELLILEAGRRSSWTTGSSLWLSRLCFIPRGATVGAVMGEEVGRDVLAALEGFGWSSVDETAAVLALKGEELVLLSVVLLCVRLAV